MSKKDKDHQIKVLEKALELACDKIADLLRISGGKDNVWFYDWKCEQVITRKDFENCYKTQAEQMLKGENDE